MRLGYRVLGRAALLYAVAVVALVFLADPATGWPGLLVLGCGLVHAGCEVALATRAGPPS